jgi:hypothetical protein
MFNNNNFLINKLKTDKESLEFRAIKKCLECGDK